MKKGKQEGYKFSDKRHPARAIVSVALGAAALITLPVLFIRSGLEGGNLGLYGGVIGMLMLAASGIGLILAGLSFKKSEIKYTFPLIGLILNALLTLAYLVVYVYGVVGA